MRKRGKRCGRLVLIVGGASSGKSEVALKLAGHARRRAFVATAQPLDAEMEERIRRHQVLRGPEWETADVPIELAAWFREKGPRYQAVVVDCLTLWLNNLCERHLLEPQLAVQVDEVIAAIRATSARVVVVTNEIGCGLVPFEPDSRHFRDMAGRVNQQFAAAADEVYVVICGQSLRLK